jgi:SanA protein
VPSSWFARNSVRLICTTLAVLLVIPTVVVGANLWVFSSANPYMYADGGKLPARSIAIVPGTKVEGGIPSVGLRQRLAAALSLYKTGKVRAILVSGNRRDARYDEATAMFRWLVDNGVREADIAVDPAGYRTLDTMQRAVRVFGVKEAIVCSQGVHLARAVFLARRAGIDAVGFVTDPRRSAHVMAVPHETLGSALAVLDTALGRGARVLGPPQPMAELGTTVALNP